MVTCPSCSADNSETSKFCSECGAALSPDYAATVTGGSRVEGQESRNESGTSSLTESSQHGRFLPGAKVADRYRIVSLVGKGGMGEVYRADDLKLGHTVALKFLPKDLAEDASRLEYFHNEVRLTRQISHPNVCRVYDIGEIDGQHFLSMEYVDGEDLRVLLRRIGRLPRDKGVQIAQQLCAGLAAAHEKGVLHRDLKPANIMLDGRGQVRITDFGLAKLAEDGKEGEIAGTPRYMAPEQLSRGETTIQSDLYSLGLILYELFTGEAVHKGETVRELLQAHDESGISQPSNVVDDMDPVVERAILRCLEKEPHERPKSAHAVAAALPGGDPLAAALAAGETPSPEMVAAAGGVGGLDPRVGGAILAVVVIGLIAVCWLSDKTNIVNHIGLDKHPRELVGDARRIITSFGYEEPAVDSAWEFAKDYDCLRFLQDSGEQPVQDSDLSRQQPPLIFFWYRHSPVPLEPEKFFIGSLRRVGEIELHDPPNVLSGMITLRLDTKGRLIEFQAVPPQRDNAETEPVGQDWLATLEENSEEILGFSLDGFTETDSQWTPPTVCDVRAAWEGSYPDGLPIRIETAGYLGRPVYLHVIGEWTRAEREQGFWEIETGGDAVVSVMIVAVLLLSVCLAFNNHRTGRGDRRGAFRLGIFVLSCHLGVWILSGAHVPDITGEIKQFYAGLAWGVLGAVEMSLLYFATEPFLRRVWPQTMISWSRVLAGKITDPLVGQHILVGVLAGVGFKLLAQLSVVSEGFQEGFATGSDSFLPALLGTQRSVWGMLLALTNGLTPALALSVLLVMSTAIFKKRWLAAAVLSTVGVCLVGLGTESILLGLAFLINILVLIRYGLLTCIVTMIVGTFLLQWPITTDTSAWYFGNGLGALGVVMAIACYGFYRSLGGRPVFAAGR